VIPRVWRIEVVVQRDGEVGRCTGELTVLPASLARKEITWDVAAVPFFLVIFVLHQRRKQAYVRSRQKKLSAAARQ
jgi:hypothetical protein